MNKKIVVLLFLAILLVFVYQAGFDSENPTEVNDVNVVHMEDPTESNEADIDFVKDDSME
ncbi:hypothetical protein ACFL6U_25995 [Planctomycetota bacterium]